MRTVVFAVLILFATPIAVQAEEGPPHLDESRLPLAWKVTAHSDVPAAQCASIGRKLGVTLESLANDVLDAGGIRLQINLARCGTVKDAETLRAKFEAIHRGPLFAARKGRDVAELVCGNAQVTARARYALGWDEPATMTWHVAVRMAPLARSDDSLWNDLFNALWAVDRGGRKDADAKVAALAPQFDFAQTLRLFRPEAKAAVETKPKAARTERKGDVLVLHFDALPKKDGVPVVAIEADVPVEAFAARRASSVDKEPLTAPTAVWPSKGTTAKKAVAEALAGHETEPVRRRAARLLAWVNAHVRFGGAKLGSRYGFEKVVAQGFGHCWDKSDAFVTLCRAAGIPARQLFGWVRGTGGHVWAEILVKAGDGKPAWLPVDATTSWLGTSTDYVPLLASEDGRVPAVWWAPPKMTASADPRKR